MEELNFDDNERITREDSEYTLPDDNFKQGIHDDDDALDEICGIHSTGIL